METIDRMKKTLQDAANTIASQQNQFESFAQKLVQCAAALNGLDVQMGAARADTLPIRFLNIHYQVRFAPSLKIPRVKVDFGRFLVTENEERKFSVITSLYLDNTGNVFESAEAILTLRTLHNSNDVCLVLLRLLSAAVAEYPV